MIKLTTKTKRGGASMFIVMFTVVILSIITLSFTRLVLSEATKTSNTDLSQSAYDSALAGIEDAKIALLRYHACLDKGARSTDNTSCGKLIKAMQTGIKNKDCSTVEKVLGREQASDTHGVVIQETQKSDDPGNNTSMLQAYTCVTIQEDLDDYRTTLDSSSRLRIVPIRSDEIDNINRVRIRWFSSVNHQQLVKNGSDISFCSNDYWNDNGKKTLKLFPFGGCNSKQQAPTTITVRLIQTDEYFDLSQLSVSKSDKRTDVGQITLVPTRTNGADTIKKEQWGESANKGENQPVKINCTGVDWMCEAYLELPNTWDNSETARSDANTYLLVSLPYGAPETDLSLQLYKDSSLYDFTGVQARIDSTGRANDLYRRIETRVELVDTYFAYPEFEITMTGGAGSNIKKTFYTTFDCWKSEDGAVSYCSNYSSKDGYANFE